MEAAPEPRRSERLHRVCDVLLLESDEPATYAEAVVSPDSEAWLEAMRSELKSMDENQVWDLVDLPPGVKAIGCKWVFKKKTDVDGNVQIHKARLVTKGYGQVQGIDYNETYSLVAMLKSARIILSIAAYFDYEIWQMDVKTAFLHGNLTEDVYMIQPERFVDLTSTSKVCKLKRSIYGLRQASRSWNIRFNEVVTGLGFIKSDEDACLYKQLSGSQLCF